MKFEDVHYCFNPLYADNVNLCTPRDRLLATYLYTFAAVILYSTLEHVASLPHTL